MFGAAGLLLPALWFSPVLVGGRAGVVSWLLYVGLPGLAAAVSGAIFGRSLVRPAGPGRERSAALRGAGIALAALLLFAPLYAGLVKTAEPGWTSVLGLAALVVEFGGLALGWALVLVGGLVGWGLYRWARTWRIPPEAI